VNAFRALGTVCCVLEGIMELEEAGGIKVLAETLKDNEVILFKNFFSSLY
jgi:hypothetical protein